MTTELGPSGGAVESKGLKTGALGLASATVVGVASTAPGYSLAASLGLRDRGRRLQGAGGDVDLVHPDGVHRGGVLLPQPRRSRLRHELHVGDPVDGPAHGPARRLELR